MLRVENVDLCRGIINIRYSKGHAQHYVVLHDSMLELLRIYATAYAFRQHYAIENINCWTGEGFEFDAKLLYLSKSMGHSTLESTKYYYSRDRKTESERNY